MLILPAIYCKADSFTPSVFCQPPSKPLFLTPYYYTNRYDEDVIRYKECILDFVAEQERAIKLHQNAAKTALERMNKFLGEEE